MIPGFRRVDGGKTSRPLQFDYENVKVWKSVIPPHVPLPFHRHDHPHVISTLTRGAMNIVEQSGATVSHI